MISSSQSLLLALILAVVAALVALLQSRAGETPFSEQALRKKMLEQAPPLRLFDGKNYSFGRFSSPVPDPNFREMDFFERVFQRKQWAFHAVSDGRWLLGFATAHLGYLQTGFIYFLDSRTGLHDHWQIDLPSFLQGSEIASSDVQDGACSKFATPFSNMHVEVCYNSRTNGWRADVRGKTKHNSKVALQVDMIRSGGPELALSYPIGPDRVSYTHKTANLAVNGTFTFLPTRRIRRHHSQTRTMMNEPFVGAGLSDYTRAQSRRYTEWFWVALCHPKRSETGEVTPRGLQFSTNNVGTLESAVWLDGEMHWVASRLTVALTNTTSNSSAVIAPGQRDVIVSSDVRYDVTSEDGDIRLEYFPRGVLPTKVKTPLVYGSFMHSYGYYRGSVTVAGRVWKIIKPLVGIFEDHSAYW